MNSFRSDERAFHDSWAEGIRPDDVLVDASFEASTAPENRFLLQKLGDIRGKKLLELGSGAGEASVYFAKKGAIVTATDISSGMLEVAKKVAKLHGVSIDTIQCPSDRLPFPDEYFDAIYAANVLHHVEIRPTLQEAHRVLKKGGIFASWDPLAHNPLINIYRRKAEKVRTAEEHPLRMRDIALFREIFSSVEIDAFWLFTLWIFIRFYIIERADPNKERYWKKVIIEHKRLEKTYRRLERLDRMALYLCPFLRRYCWNLVAVARK